VKFQGVGEQAKRAALANLQAFREEVGDPLLGGLLASDEFQAMEESVQARTLAMLSLASLLGTTENIAEARDLFFETCWLAERIQGRMEGVDWAWPLVLSPLMVVGYKLGDRYKDKALELSLPFAEKAARSKEWGGPQDARYGYYRPGQVREFPDERLEPKIHQFDAKTEENGWWAGFYQLVGTLADRWEFLELGDLFAGHVYTRYTTRDDGNGFWLLDDTHYIPQRYREIRELFGHDEWPEDDYRTDNQGICPFSPGPGVARFTFNRPCEKVNPTPNYAAAGCGVGLPYVLIVRGFDGLTPGWLSYRHIWGVVQLGRHYVDWVTMTYKGVIEDCGSFHYSERFGGMVSEWGEPASYMQMGPAAAAVVCHHLGEEELEERYLSDALSMLRWAEEYPLSPDPSEDREHLRLMVWAVVLGSYARTALAFGG